MKKIALDVDGVLLNFMPAFDQAAEIILGRKIIPHKDEYKQDYYHLSKRVDTTEEKVAEILQYMQDSRMYASLEALPGVKESLIKIKEAGYKIYVVTALPEHAKDMRLENLLNVLNFVPDEIHCVGMGMSKAEALKSIMPDVFIDDRMEYLASAPFVYHLAWMDQREVQKDKNSQVDVHVHSLAEWVENHMPRVTKKLDRYYEQKAPLQIDIKLESPIRRYKFQY